MIQLFPLLLLAVVVALIVEHINVLAMTALAIVTIFAITRAVRVIRKNRYFASEHFRSLKAELAAVVAEHNEVVSYVEEIRTRGSFELGGSSTGQYAHLASFNNTSAWNYRRDRNVAEYGPHVHNTTLQIVRRASEDPIKYLMKYFSITADQGTLASVQRVSDDVARLEAAITNVKEREAGIRAHVAPPPFILKHYAREFWDQVGVHLSPIQVPYPRYRFQYVSAGGNSSQETPIILDTPTLEALSATLAQRIRWTKSAAGQRALMTSKLRTQIKERDRFTCQKCGVSVAVEPHLLLEVDHIVPVSRGGLSITDNLQTLCWRCNRAKGAKMAS